MLNCSKYAIINYLGIITIFKLNKLEYSPDMMPLDITPFAMLKRRLYDTRKTGFFKSKLASKRQLRKIIRSAEFKKAVKNVVQGLKKKFTNIYPNKGRFVDGRYKKR